MRHSRSANESACCQLLSCKQVCMCHIIKTMFMFDWILTALQEHQQQYHWATQQLQRQGYAASLWQAAR